MSGGTLDDMWHMHFDIKVSLCLTWRGSDRIAYRDPPLLDIDDGFVDNIDVSF